MYAQITPSYISMISYKFKIARNEGNFSILLNRKISRISIKSYPSNVLRNFCNQHWSLTTLSSTRIEDLRDEMSPMGWSIWTVIALWVRYPSQRNYGIRVLKVKGSYKVLNFKKSDQWFDNDYIIKWFDLITFSYQKWAKFAYVIIYETKI